MKASAWFWMMAVLVVGFVFSLRAVAWEVPVEDLDSKLTATKALTWEVPAAIFETKSTAIVLQPKLEFTSPLSVQVGPAIVTEKTFAFHAKSDRNAFCVAYGYKSAAEGETANSFFVGSKPVPPPKVVAKFVRTKNLDLGKFWAVNTLPKTELPSFLKRADPKGLLPFPLEGSMPEDEPAIKRALTADKGVVVVTDQLVFTDGCDEVIEQIPCAQ